MEREFIAHHIREGSELEHLIASMLPRKYSEDYSMHSMDSKPGQQTPESVRDNTCQAHELHKHSKHLTKHLQKHSMPTGLDYEELGGLSDPGQRDCSKAWNILE